jgi:7,8-dihydropterin-6-yl-methyl-4-(beta-D-ribofuranosyl)aminobenzene 5'-phosphate synthase
MKVEVLNVYSNETEKGSRLKGDHGQSFLISTEKEKILFDTGAKGKILIHNMKELDICPDEIDKLVLSHGHFDHTGGLPGFLDMRTFEWPLPVYAHPLVREKKIGKIGPIRMKLGFPDLSREQEEKVEFLLNKASQQLTRCLRTTGEISERDEVDGVEPKAMHLEDGKLAIDPVLDDLSLVLSTTEGEVIIAGCAHSGILNICEAVKKSTGRKIIAIIGGTHMVSYTREEVLHVSEVLKEKYDYPDLFLNHCTDKLPIPFVKKTPAFDIIKEVYGADKVNKCYVGTKLSFESHRAIKIMPETL